MVRIKINKKRHLIALVLTLCVFTIGLFIGNTLSGERVKFIQDQIYEQNLNLESIQTQYLYLSTLNQNKNCPAVSKTLESNLLNLETTRARLEEYSKQAKVSEKTHVLLKKEYIISQIRYWLLARETKKTCERDMATILYFYSKDCEDCTKQALILDYLKMIFKERLLIFSLDTDIGEPLVSILQNNYYVTEYPSLIIEEKKFTGLTSKNTILKEICAHYSENKEGCLNEKN